MNADAVKVNPFVSLQDAMARATAAGVPSPCVGVCKMSAHTGYCEGCWRTRDEIAAWRGSSDALRLAVWQQVEARQQDAGLVR